MESIFLLGEEERAAFLRHMLHSFRSTYICLWSYSPLPSNCLLFLDGYYNEAEKMQQPSSSSSGGLASSLFNAYCVSLNYINDNIKCLPGFAFKNNVPYLEVKVDSLQPTMLTTQPQMQFYQEAGIKTVIFMGCTSGEIELGFSTEPQVNLQVEIESWFPADFSCKQTLLIPDPNQQCPVPILSPPRSSSSQQMITTAFTRYRVAAAATHHNNPNSLFRRSLSFFRNLNTTTRIRTTQSDAELHPQMQHVIAERRRRHKLNQSFQILRASLLPQLFKKDKASVLSSTVKYLSSLRSEMEELKKINAILEMQLQSASTDQREISVEIGDVITSPSSISQAARFLDLRINLRSTGDQCSLSDLVARVSGLILKHYHRNLSLLSLKSNTTVVESTPLHGLVLRLKLEGDEEFDESGFQEAVRRVVVDEFDESGFQEVVRRVVVDEFDLPH